MQRAVVSSVRMSMSVSYTHLDVYKRQQFLFGTGTPDVDDVLLNALGALLGYGLCRLVRRAQR